MAVRAAISKYINAYPEDVAAAISLGTGHICYFSYVYTLI
jgi:hypothetical protein